MSKYDVGLDRQANDPLNIMLDHIDPNATVLEFGCAGGRMTKYMHDHLNSRVYIVEYNKDDYEQAKEYAEDGVCGDIQQFEWVEKFATVKFDYIIFADVLEHLYCPETVLEKASTLLKEDGIVWISVPNIAHNDIILNLYENKFQYTSTGLLDDTHIRFFTYESLKNMCEKLKLKPIYIDCISVPTNCTEQRINEIVHDNDFLELLDKRETGEIYQYVIGVGKKTSVQHEMLEIENKIDERTSTVIRNVFFDKGNGFDGNNYLSLRAFRKENVFSEKIEVSKDVVRVRFDPVEKIPCIIKNLRVFTDNGENIRIETNAEYKDKQYNFRNFDAQIIATLDKAAKWIVFAGNIEYTYNIMPTNTAIVRKLKNEVFNYEKQIEKLTQKLTQLEKEKEEESKVHSNQIQELNCELKRNTLQNEFKQKLSKQIKEEQHTLLKKYQEELEKQNGEICRLQGEVDIFSKKYNEIVNSNTWKGTEKLRRIADNVKQYSKRKNIENNIISTVLKNNDNVRPSMDRTWRYDSDINLSENPMVSIIVPNYNHEPYLRDRLNSIYSQTYKNYEVILLDDCSTDDSRNVLLEYAELYADRTKVAFNSENCGKVFRQWDKGLELAKGDLIWIAESDDYCEANFLETMVPLLKHKSIMLAFARSVFVQDGKKVWSTEEYLNGLSNLKWDKPFTMTANDWVDLGFSRKNIIPNVSSAVFRNVGRFSEETNPIWEQMKLCGDWTFYLNLIKGGCVSYTNKTTNYYRVHDSSTSLNVQKSDNYYKEQCEVSKYIVKNYNVNIKVFNDVLIDLKEHYKAIRQVANGDIVENFYNIEDIKKDTLRRHPNILIGFYSMQYEMKNIYLVHLANAMKKNGLAVTAVDFQIEEKDDRAEKLLDLSIPVVKAKSFDDFSQIVSRLGGEIICSDHPTINDAISLWIDNNSDLKCKKVTIEFEKSEDENLVNYNDLIDRIISTNTSIIYSKNKELQFVKKTIEESGLFDKEFYRTLYFDSVKNETDLIEHYIKIGEKENYDPSANFDTAFYKSSVTGLQESGLNALYHYIVYGKNEMRSPVDLNRKLKNSKGELYRGYRELKRSYEKVEGKINLLTGGTLLGETVAQIKMMMNISFDVRLKILVEKNNLELEEKLKRRIEQEKYPFVIEIICIDAYTPNKENSGNAIRGYIWNTCGLKEQMIMEILPYIVYCADETLNEVIINYDCWTHGMMYSVAELYDRTQFDAIVPINQCIVLESIWQKLNVKNNEVLVSNLFDMGLGGKILQIYCSMANQWKQSDGIELKNRDKKNIMISIYSLSYGGGEIMPIRLANQLKAMGQSVLVHVYDSTLEIKKVRKMLDVEIPILRLNDEQEMSVALTQYKIDVINTHHQTLQSFFGRVLNENPRLNAKIRHVATSHGMYNAFSTDDMKYILDNLKNTVDCWTYVADKNVEPFKGVGAYNSEKFIKIPNGIESPCIHPMKRSDLGIADDAFVFCLASRAIAEKGWKEAIEAVKEARIETGKDIHLILAGDGPIYRELIGKSVESYIHLLGFIDNPCDYYAISEAMLFPSYYASESAPLSLIEALQCGIPVIASNIGDIKQMITCEYGMAGSVFNLSNWNVPIELLVEQMRQMIMNQKFYCQCVKCAKIKAKEFGIEVIAKKYLKAFNIKN